MKFSICILLLSILGISACNKKDVITSKKGVSLPTVTNLAIEQVDQNHLRLSWQIPAEIPSEIAQPLMVFVEVREVVNPTRIVSIFNTTLSDAPTEFLYEIPDPAKTYHLTVKLHGTKKMKDVNYSSNIYSLGQTVVYN